jgi:predicted alpha/beta hydrolase
MTNLDLSDINPHLALAASESFVSNSEREWLRWCKRVEKFLGHNLDGNQDCDGYSIDMAYACFEAGDSAMEYATQATINKFANDYAFGPRVEA